jgi:Flp pilus assembly protein TadG
MISDRGASALPMMMVAGVVVAVGVASTSVGLLLAGREQVSIASEAAALAAAVATYPPAGGGDPISAAREIAAANGATLVSCSCSVDPTLRPRTVEVETSSLVDVPLFGRLEVGRKARAEFDPGLWLGG